ncbi:hypothetical protein NX029_26170 [Cytobacillus firmus]|nr:hypothetical protein [Cytobacillus firmus]
MKVITGEVKAKKEFLQLGDIVETNSDFYLVIKESEGYIAKCIADGYCGSFGRFDTLEALNDHFYNNSGLADKSTVYKKDEFYLVIQAKK